jgi:hypothetical protein
MGYSIICQKKWRDGRWNWQRCGRELDYNELVGYRKELNQFSNLVLEKRLNWRVKSCKRSFLQGYSSVDFDAKWNYKNLALKKAKLRICRPADSFKRKNSHKVRRGIYLHLLISHNALQITDNTYVTKWYIFKPLKYLVFLNTVIFKSVLLLLKNTHGYFEHYKVHIYNVILNQISPCNL